MSTERAQPTLADYILLVLSPALIMTLVGSLVFFLAEVCYAGQYGGRLHWILFFFIFGAVLVARISMLGEIASRAWVYGPILCVLAWLSLQKLVEYPPGSPVAGLRALINFGLVVLVWWSVHRLTWSCTHIEGDVEVSGIGLLQAAGLEGTEQRYGLPEEDLPEGPRLSWIERFLEYRRERRRRHTPGVWVVYFSLAALPIFGLGQSLLPLDSPERRRYTFALLVLYVGSALGLLLTTTFLGLRRYLRQRGLQMQGAMAATWLGVGGTLLVALLALAALLPRPRDELPLLPRDWLRQGARSDEEATRRAASRGDRPDRPDGSNPGEMKDQAKDAPARDRGKEDPEGKDDSGKKGSRPGEEEGEEGGGGQKQGQTAAGRALGKLSQALESLSEKLRKVVFVLVVVLSVLLVLLAVLRYLAPVLGWAGKLLEALGRLWASLFRKGAEADTEVADAEETAPPGPVPFRAYPNPFLTGAIVTMSVREAIRFTFAAVDAWAHEQGLGRRPGETPLELVERLGVAHPSLRAELLRLADLYGHAVYSDAGLSPSLKETLRRFWDRLEQTQEDIPYEVLE